MLKTFEDLNLLLENTNCELKDIAFKKKSKVDIVMKNAAKITFSTPISSYDFAKIWNAKKRKIKLLQAKIRLPASIGIM